MPGTWSISTTIRNPERNVPFLKALSKFEGQVFDERVQRNFFKELIKLKAYKPTGISKYFKDKYEEPEEFTYEEVEEIFSQVHYSNEQYDDDQEEIYAMRGRTAVGNLNKMGLVIARKSMGSVAISNLGKEVMSGNADLSNVFLRYCLKWQLPNLAEKGYKGFNIIPFIATLHVIHKINREWKRLGKKPVGISKVEFALFLITLIDYRNINKKVKEIIKFRLVCQALDKNERHKYVDMCFVETAIEVFNLSPSNEKVITKKVNNLFDYADSAIRYYRQTKMLIYRGNGRYVDLAPTRIVEIRSILQNFDGGAIEFDGIEDYLDYVADINQPVLPWENVEDLQSVYENLLDQANNLQKEIESQFRGQELHHFVLIQQELNSITEYNVEISRLREVIRTLQNDLSILKERSLQNIDSYIEKLMELANRRRSVSGQDPLNLEWYVAMSLMALDDAKEIAPNYAVGDDNIPLFTAPGGTADIECYYNAFNMICEVTLLKGRDQWYNEGQPVMRHLRDFEEKVLDRSNENYCLFIAPNIHRDTLNTFWMSVKLGYEGQIQKIIPLTIEQYVKVLEVVKVLNYQGKRVNHVEIKQLFDLIFESHKQAGNVSTVWLENIDVLIQQWGNSLSA
ncbi:AlwI family type II restriction endonuclease [Mesobacillus maritimus]|uniref:AlwI family type II restriction endonuclease n=1 Tax=Mesobacillus maritimus TaxID=1643336 RepID=UPI00203C31A2|nr:AlwI family type II restriction endonuclease [Mesobacillus maritimus]MCM3585003.1 AlwI family type II restriction endonuclease [Mesobacillus maritimus]